MGESLINCAVRKKTAWTAGEPHGSLRQALGRASALKAHPSLVGADSGSAVRTPSKSASNLDWINVSSLPCFC